MQRHSIELGAFHDEHPGGQFILKDLVAAFSAGRLHHPTCHFAKWISDSCDRASLREYRPADDSQPDPPARRSPLFRAFADSIFSSVVVAAQGRQPDETIGVALSFTDRSNLRVSTVSLVRSLLSFFIVEVSQHVGRDFWCGDDTNRLARLNAVGSARCAATGHRSASVPTITVGF